MMLNNCILLHVIFNAGIMQFLRIQIFMETFTLISNYFTLIEVTESLTSCKDVPPSFIMHIVKSSTTLNMIMPDCLLSSLWCPIT